MDALQEMAIEWACAKTITRYAEAVNTWDIDLFVSLFATDAIWQRPAVQPLNGHAEIRGFMKSQATNRLLRHINATCLITVEDEDHASGISYTTVYDTPGSAKIPSPLPGPDMVVEYRDKYIRLNDEWKIARRDTTVLFHQAVR